MTNMNQCLQCGQFDDHPKVMYGDALNGGEVSVYHLDCLPFSVEQELRADHGDSIDAAKSGVHGDALRQFQIEKTARLKSEAEAQAPVVTQEEGA